MNSIFLFVGKSGQGKRISQLVGKLGLPIKIEFVSTANFLDLKEKSLNRFRAIFIVNRDSDHERSLRHLAQADYCGFIFLEKPIFISPNYLEFLESFDASRTYVNLPSKFTSLYQILQDKVRDPKLGELLHSRLEMSYGIFHKNELHSNWRFDSESNPSGVLSTLGIHYVHLFRNLIGPIKHSYISTAISSDAKEAPGILTGEICLNFEDSIASILLSYQSPYQFSMKLTFSNALLEVTDSSIELWYPRDTFDELGLFARPPMAEHLDLKTLDWEVANEASVSFFIEHVLSSTDFPADDWEIAKAVNRIVCVQKR